MRRRKLVNEPAAASKAKPRLRARRHKNTQVRIRPIKVSDFEFIRTLASNTKGYTVCSPYVLWMLSRFQPQLCAVAEDAQDEPVGYLLAIPAGARTDAVFVWQLACTFRGLRLGAPGKLVKHLKSAIARRGTKTLFFTTVPESKVERNLRSLAEEILAASPVVGAPVPEPASYGEHEYRLSLPGRRT